jgi:hypothetical protein
MSMMWSVETRTVLARRPILEFALNLPFAAKVDVSAPPVQQTKVLLKRLFLRYFPRELLVEKQGFAGFPAESSAYLGDLRDYLVHHYLGIRAVDGAPSSATLWKLANVEYFIRSFAN